MGGCSFLFSCSFCRFNVGAYHSTLGLDKKLLQITIWSFTKASRWLTCGFFTYFNIGKNRNFLKLGKNWGFFSFFVSFPWGGSFLGKECGWRLCLRSIGDMGKIKTSKNEDEMGSNGHKLR